MRAASFLIVVAIVPATVAGAEQAGPKTKLTGRVVDAETGEPLAARVYLEAAGGGWLLVRSASPQGSAVPYAKQRQAGSVEIHTTVSAHPFVADVPPGKYTLAVERGKEYFPAKKSIEVGSDPAEVEFRLRRWIDMASLGWYSGDTHVHRSVDELRNVLLAEDLNVGLPLTYWVTTAYTSPSSGSRTAAPKPESIRVDPTHVIYPVNTEYEIFTVGGTRHTLGAVFALGHQRPFEVGVPPVKPIAEEAYRQGALLDLDKHSWPWSLMLVPVMNVDLFELANNHVWRTRFGFRRWSEEMTPDFMNLERDAEGLTEWGWIDFGFQTYYALLNCGFRMRPTAGTANGVHPVPLGFGRVYVHLPDGFSYQQWMEGLGAGRSFVTTGPMLFVEVNGAPPGATLRYPADSRVEVRLTGRAVAATRLRPVEVAVNGRVVKRIPAENRKNARGAFESPIDATVRLDGSGWIAVRAFEDRADGRIRFAHTSPVHVEVPGKPLRPRREEVEYFVRRMKDEIERNQDVLRPDELQEYRDALRVYEDIASQSQ